MSPNPLALGGVRPSAVVNAEIRALVQRGLHREGARARYASLVEEWTRAVAVERRIGDVEEAA